ncbi:hypothetical protein [Leptospira interrogans]|uniref:hypothetical protein n=1 Tax=Leptospira interrogans TaxID=173 RepID=UPI0007730130|nr:hypothetical protein [Leptospira interrogans]
MKFRFQKLGSIFVCIFYNLFFSFVSLEAITIEVFIPLCDGKSLVCGKGKAGDPRSLEENLYWGAAFGAETFFKRNSNFKILEIKERKSDSPILRTLIIEKKRKQNETYTKLIIYAYAGDKIDNALLDFLNASSGKSPADIIVWSGHNRLMDRIPPKLQSQPAKTVAVLACESEKYFDFVLRSIGAKPIVLTKIFMAPKAYLLEALTETVSKFGAEDKKSIRSAMIRSYAKYQKISLKAAGSVFSKLE